MHQVQHSRKAKQEYTTKKGTVVRLTKQQKDYADLKLANPNAALTDIVKQAYPNAKDSNYASTIAAINEKNQSIQIYTNEQISNAKRRIGQLVHSEREDIALRASQDILDREHGKAVQQVQTESKAITINIDLSGDNGLLEPQTD